MMRIKCFNIVSVFILIFSSCTDGFVELNKDPNKIEIGGIESSGLLEPMLMNGTNALISNMTTYGLEIAQMTGQTSSPREEQAYKIMDSDWTGRWNALYRWANNAQHLYETAKSQNDENYQAIGLIMKVYYLQNCTDLFGSIAYTEALKVSEGIYKPVIESQKQVYEAMMNDLELANSLINMNKQLSKSSRDLIYSGDMLSWKKFANSLHLRLLMRVSGRNNSFSPSVGERIAKIINNPTTYPVISSNTENASVKCNNSASYYRHSFNTTDIPAQASFNDAKLSNVLIDMMVYDYESGECDPRLKIWGKPAPQNGYKWQGCVVAGTFENRSLNNPKTASRHYEALVRDDNPNTIMDYSEVLFIKSEAAFNGWISGNAKDYYEQAIRASVERWASLGKYAQFPDQTGNTSAVVISELDILNMLTSPKTQYNNTLQRIQEQKWLSLFWVIGFEPYNEMRRTGYPDLKLGQLIIDRGYTQGKFMARWGYPTVSLANNRENYRIAYIEQGGNPDLDPSMSDVTLPVWWSGQAISIDGGSPWPHSFRTEPSVYIE